ncbi:MAG: 2-haloalkanoic acid dehalogenase [Hyphomicrobiales bacterium]|nr:2-haloalkanoic acid dehalogenase [Hyphomicrobiales bacterium]
MAPTIAVFDIGNVLLRWDMGALFRKLVREDELGDFLARVCPHDWHAQLDAGATYAQAIAERTALYPQYAAAIRAYDPRWQETLTGAIQGTVDILEDLRAAGVPTYAITNFPAEKFDETCALYPFLQGFLGVVVSGRERLVKPDPAIFRLFLERHGLRAHDCAFIDDNLANVAAAQALGFHALAFTDPAKLRADLCDLRFPLAAGIAGDVAAS